MIQWKTYIISEKASPKLDMIIDCLVNNKPMIKDYINLKTIKQSAILNTYKYNRNLNWETFHW